MNIKGLGASSLLNDLRPVEKVERVIKSDQSNERDGNGKQEFQQKNSEQKHPMTPEQLAKAMEHLRNLDAVKEHNWDIDLEVDESGQKFVVVKDNLGSLIRRIPEIELWTLPTDKDSRGQILKKVA